MKLIKTLFISILVLAISIPSLANTADLKESFVQWSGSKITGKTHTGKLFFKDVKLTATNDGFVGSEFVIDINTLTVEDIQGKWATKFINHMKSEDFFEVSKYPTAKLVIEKIDDKNLTGKLTIKGKSHTVTMPYTKKGNTYVASLTFDRTKFNMTYGSKNFFKNLGDKVINDEVMLKISLVMK